MTAYKKHICVEFIQNENTQVLQFPEYYSKINRIKWMIIRIISPLNVSWVK